MDYLKTILIKKENFHKLELESSIIVVLLVVAKTRHKEVLGILLISKFLPKINLKHQVTLIPIATSTAAVSAI